MTLAAQPAAAGTHRDLIRVTAQHVGTRSGLLRLAAAVCLGALAAAMIVGAWLVVLGVLAGGVLLAQASAARRSYADTKSAADVHDR